MNYNFTQDGILLCNVLLLLYKLTNNLKSHLSPESIFLTTYITHQKYILLLYYDILEIELPYTLVNCIPFRKNPIVDDLMLFRNSHLLVCVLISCIKNKNTNKKLKSLVLNYIQF